MGLKEEKRFLRGVKTLFFLITMLFSLLLFSAPILLVIADMFLPSAILSINHPSLSLSLESLSTHLKTYDFKSSLIDIPLLSIVRSSVILCVYCFCDGPRLSRGPYLGIATFCSSLSLIFVTVKASFVLGGTTTPEGGHEGGIRGMELALILSSLVLAVGHIVVAYRTSCRERRKLLIYKIDIEAVTACHKGFPTYNKILQHVRVN